jgi:hypothetical protein
MLSVDDALLVAVEVVVDDDSVDVVDDEEE